MKATWKMSLINCSLETPFRSLHDIYCLKKKKKILLSSFPTLSAPQPVLIQSLQADHIQVPSQRAKHMWPWTYGQSAHVWKLWGLGMCFRVEWQGFPLFTSLSLAPWRWNPSLIWSATHTSAVFSIWPSPLWVVSSSAFMTWWWAPKPALYSCGPS